MPNINQLIALGGGYQPPSFDYATSQRNQLAMESQGLQNELTKQQISVNPEMQKLEAHKLEVKKMYLDWQEKIQKYNEGDDIETEYEMGGKTIVMKGKQKNVAKVLEKFAQYPDQVDKDSVAWASSLGVGIKAKKENVDKLPTARIQEYQLSVQQGEKRSFTDWDMATRKASAPSTNIKIDAPKRQSSVVDSFLKDVSKNYDTAVSEMNAINRLDAALELVKKGGNEITGLSGAVKSALAPYATAIGMNTEKMDDAQLLRTLLDANAGSLRMEVVGPGPVTEFEQKILQKVSGKEMAAAEGVKKILEYHRKQKENKLESFNTQLKNASEVEGYSEVTKLYPLIKFNKRSDKKDLTSMSDEDLLKLLGK